MKTGLVTLEGGKNQGWKIFGDSMERDKCHGQEQNSTGELRANAGLTAEYPQRFWTRGLDKIQTDLETRRMQ